MSYGAGSTVGLTHSTGLFQLSLISKINVGEYTYNFSSTLEVSSDNFVNANGTYIFCKGIAKETLAKSAEICIIGKNGNIYLGLCCYFIFIFSTI